MMNVVTRFGRQLLDNQTEKGVIYVRENIGKKFVFYHMGLMRLIQMTLIDFGYHVQAFGFLALKDF